MTDNILNSDGWALLSCGGADNAKFLQGHLTCDVAELAKRDSVLGAACDLKGRVIASMVLFGGGAASAETAATAGAGAGSNRGSLASGNTDAAEPDTLLLLPKSAVAPLMELWGKYLPLYRGVTITELEAFSVQLGGADELRVAAAPKGAQNPPAPAASSAVAAPAAGSSNQAAATANDTRLPASAGGLTAFFVDKGIPMATAATSGVMIPQAMNYEELGGISFTKGCYLGQEVVARVHYKGKSSRACQRVSFALAGEGALQNCRPGAPIHAIVKDKQSEAGLLVNCYIKEDTGYGIALLSKNPVDRAHLFINNQPVKLV